MPIFAMKMPIFLRSWGEVGEMLGRSWEIDSFVLALARFDERIGKANAKERF